MTRIKICGIRTPEIAATAVECGADALGFVFHGGSPRFVTEETAREIILGLPSFVNRVGVFVNQSIEEIGSIVRATGIDTVQLHGEYTPGDVDAVKAALNLPVIFAYRIRSLDDRTISAMTATCANGILIDKWSAEVYGGSGEAIDIDETLSPTSREFISRKVVFAGGIDKTNAADLIRVYKPYGIDLSSGVESSKGVKDAGLIREFFESIKEIRL